MKHKELLTFFENADVRIAGLIAGIGELHPYHEQDLFEAMISSLISQQLSTKASATIFSRFKQHFNGILDPGILLNTSLEEMRTLGISRQKCTYIHDVSKHFLEKPEMFEQLEELDDEEIISNLIAIKGVGRWTAEMLLMFTLQRSDVFPVDDLGIQQSMISLYQLDSKPAKSELIQLSKAWIPQRTWACIYLWKNRDLAK